jgi:hypothetical protein
MIPHLGRKGTYPWTLSRSVLLSESSNAIVDGCDEPPPPDPADNRAVEQPNEAPTPCHRVAWEVLAEQP